MNNDRLKWDVLKDRKSSEITKVYKTGAEQEGCDQVENKLNDSKIEARDQKLTVYKYAQA